MELHDTTGNQGTVVTTDVNGIATKSGLTVSDNGRVILITQGLTGYTLVGGKKILIRLFYPSQDTVNQVTSVVATVLFRGRQSTYLTKETFLIPTNELIFENNPPNGPSIGIILAGRVFENLSYYHAIEFRVMAGSSVVSTDTTPYMEFSQAGTLRILAKAIESISRTAPWGNKITSNITWLFELHEAMVRLGAMFPVKDGVYFGSQPPAHDGLGYLIGENVDAWPTVCPNGEPPSTPDNQYPNFLVCDGDLMNKHNTEEAIRLRSNGTRIDITVVWRPRDPLKTPPPDGEPCGGRAPFGVSPPPDRRLGSVCGGRWHNVENTAPIMAQEIAHNFGAVSGFSPHTDGGNHSKDISILDPYAFDFVLLRPYYPVTNGYLGPFVGDVMSYAWQQGKDLTLFNAYDWEHLRDRLSKFSMVSSIAYDPQHDISQETRLDLQNTFTDLQKIDVANPELILSSKPGFEWYWTNVGFQMLKKGEHGNRSITSNIETVFSTLEKLGITEFYAPRDGNPMPVVISPNNSNKINCQIGDAVGFSFT
jgi:hypothetical protein